MDSIEILPTNVIDQIAAGEVVERPAHLVKELVENSIDAGATKIQVEFSSGGQKVKVSDNGRGIVKEQLPLAFARHATSKIKTGEDLWSLASFGFRGEALASLSAVSKVKVVSKTKGEDTAYALNGRFGSFDDVEVSGGSQGTTIWIDDLFENVPARRKFLKSDAAEATQVKNVLKAMALAHFNVEFRILYKENLEFYWPTTSSLLERAQQVLSVENLYFGEGECEGLKARVFVGAPHETVKTRRSLWLFAQGRWIQDRGLQAAVLDAYRGLLMHNEYPVAVIFVESPPDEIDVNVHPTKSQVKFSNSSNAFRAVHRAVRGVLEKAPWLDNIVDINSSNIAQLNKESQPPKAETDKPIKSRRTQDLITNMSFEADEFNNTQWQQKEVPQKKIEEQSEKDQVTTYKSASLKLDSPSHRSSEVNSKINEVQEVSLEKDPQSTSNKITSDKKNKGYWSQLQVLSQAAHTYILTQSSKSLIVVDQHAAHERVVYESLMHQWKEGGVEVQNLLIPLTVKMDPERVEALLAVREDLLKMGLDVDSTGPENIAVSTIPTLLKEKAIVKAIEYLGLELVEKGGSFALEKALGNIAATMACHSVVRAGQALSLEEMKSLLASMDEYPLSSFCPHGRPVFVEIPFNKLEKDFGRIV